MNALGRIARGVAKQRMKKAGITQICKKKDGKHSYFSKRWKEVIKKDGKHSFFSKHWKEVIKK